MLFKELFLLSFPLILTLSAGNLLTFVNRSFLSHHSLEAFNACTIATILSCIFQEMYIQTTSITKVFIGRYFGSQEYHKIGVVVWQMIWFSLLATLVLGPLGFLSVSLFFNGSSFEDPPTKYYFYCLMISNVFLSGYTAISSFFLILKKTKFFFLTTLATQLLNIALDYCLIFGIFPWIPSLGIVGAGIALCLSQLVLFLCFFIRFIYHRNYEIYHLHDYHLNWQTLKVYLKTALPRGMSRVMIFASYLATTYYIMQKGEVYQTVFALGNSLFLIGNFVQEGIGQAVLIMSSKLLGAKDLQSLQKLRHYGYVLVFISACLLSIPLIIFPETIISMLSVEKMPMEIQNNFSTLCVWIWLYFFCVGLKSVDQNMMLSFGQTLYDLGVSSLTWILFFFPILIGIYFWQMPPHYMWMIMLSETLIKKLFYWVRLNKMSQKLSMEPIVI